jgi:alpha-1,6-mannosyltransferase
MYFQWIRNQLCVCSEGVVKPACQHLITCQFACFVIICDATQFYSEVGGGVGRYLKEKRAYIRDHTDDTHLLLVPGARDEVIREGRLMTCTIKSQRLNDTSRYRVLLNLRKAQEALLELKPDIIESGDPYQLGWQLIHTGQLLNIPVVGFYHSHFPEAHLRTVMKYCGPWIRDVVLAYAEDYISRLYNEFNATMVPSSFLKQLLVDWGVQNAHYLHLGVNLNVFSPGQPQQMTPEELGLERGREVLLYVGRLAGEKNTRMLLKTFEMLHQREPNRYSFIVVGDGTHRATVEELKNRTSSFYWEPYCQDSERLADFYRLSDCFVHPGIHETFGLVALESQACACPVAGIRGSYMDANIFAGLEHWAAENSPMALAGAIENILAAGAKELGERALLRVQQQFSWESVFSRQGELYRELIAKQSELNRHGGLFVS